ncbi:MAG TPA: hypothetical protein VF659_06225 [Pyrinomonadaceae bacterium]|jgi:hypothetical protein
MRRTFAPILLSLACAAALAGCRRSAPEAEAPPGAGSPGDVRVDSVVRDFRGFTDELALKVESAPDPKAGVAEAQSLLDSRKTEMSARIGALRQRTLAGDSSARGKWLEAEVDGAQRVRGLKLKYLDAASRDPELKAALERLAADYESMFKER